MCASADGSYVWEGFLGWDCNTVTVYLVELVRHGVDREYFHEFHLCRLEPVLLAANAKLGIRQDKPSQYLNKVSRYWLDTGLRNNRLRSVHRTGVGGC